MKNYPFIKITIFFIIGIILGKILTINQILIISLVVLVFGYLISIIFFPFVIKRFLKVSVIYILSILFGFTLFQFNYPVQADYPFKQYKIKDAIVFGSLNDLNLLTKGRITGVLHVDSILTKDFKNKSSYNFIIKIADENPKRVDYLFNKLKIGNRIKCVGYIYKAKGIKNPGEFDYYKYLASKGINAIISVNKFENLKIVDNDFDYLLNLIFTIRKNIDSQLKSLYDYESYSLLRGLLLADRGELDYKIKNNFINAGVVHVLAVSGLHVGYVVLIFLVIFNRFNYLLKYILTILGLALFILITGAHPPVVRASIMAFIIILTQLSNRSSNGINSLAIAAFIILLYEPNQLFSPGFQLSFSAVLSILIFYPFFKNSINKLNTSSLIRKILLFSAVSFAAQIGTLPFTLYYFNRLSLLALFANLLVIPLVGIILALGIVSLVVSTVWLWGGFIFSATNYVLIHFLFDFVNFVGNLSYSHLFINQFSLFDSVLFYIFLIAILLLWYRINNTFVKILFITLLSINYFTYIKIDDNYLFQNHKLNFFTFSLRDGYSSLIKFPDGTFAIINAGKADKNFSDVSKIIIPFLQYLQIKEIEYGIVMQSARGYTDGFYYLLKNSIVRNIIKQSVDSLNSEDLILENEIKQFNTAEQYFSNKPIRINNSQIYFISIKNNNSNKANNFLKLIYRNNSFLIADINYSVDSQSFSEDTKAFLKSDILIFNAARLNLKSFKELSKIVKPLYNVMNILTDNSILENRNNQFNKKRIINVKEKAVLFSADGNIIKRVDWKHEFH